jgi:ribosomal-protein-alanine N-acetyltransferase
MTIRPLTELDAAEMADLEKQCFSLPWSYSTIYAELQNPVARVFGAFIGGRLAGYAGMQIILDEGYITNIATAPECRRMGVADKLMTELLALAEARKLAFMTLEARESNSPARLLYEKYGFVVTGKRKGYYDEPKEDAILMTREFC